MPIHDWNRPETPYVLIDMRTLAFVSIVLDDGPRTTGDPEGAHIFTAGQAMSLAIRLWGGDDAKLGKDHFAPIPYNVGAKLFDQGLEIANLRGEFAEAQAVIRGASLMAEDDTEVKLTLQVETAEPHEGGGSVAYFELESGYVVVSQEAWDEASSHFSE